MNTKDKVKNVTKKNIFVIFVTNFYICNKLNELLQKKHKLLHTKQIVIFATNCYIFTHFVIY